MGGTAWSGLVHGDSLHGIMSNIEVRTGLSGLRSNGYEEGAGWDDDTDPAGGRLLYACHLLKIERWRSGDDFPVAGTRSLTQVAYETPN